MVELYAAIAAVATVALGRPPRCGNLAVGLNLPCVVDPADPAHRFVVDRDNVAHRSAPRVLGPQPRRHLLEPRLRENRALAPNAFLGHVEHPVQAYPAGAAVVIPCAGADTDPVPVARVVF